MRSFAAATQLGIVARAMTDADLPFVAALYASTRQAELAATGWPDAMREAFLDQQHRAQHQHYRTHYADMDWLILERDGEAIGRLYLDEAAESFCVVDISLVAAERGQGYGRALLEDVMAAARGAGKTVSIHVEKTNPARRLYDRLGFKVVEDLGIYDLMIWQPPGL